jgi:hypothetical protein
MGLHERAWEGLKVVILAKKPMMAMRLEQAIATASPATEVQLSSFESYEQAYTFCKHQKDVGLIFVHENAGDSPFLSVFRELAAHYDNSGLPAFGVVLFDQEPSGFAEKAIGKNPHLLDYISTSSFFDDGKVHETLRAIWSQYVTTFEEQVLPRALQSSLLAVAEEKLGAEGIHFLLRLTTNLLSDVNISWLENVAATWAPFLSVVRTSAPAVLTPHEHLTRFIELCQGEPVRDIKTLSVFLQGKAPLCKKVTHLASYLEDQRKRGTLEEQLRELAKLSKPGAPKLVRHLAKNIDRILEFQLDAGRLVASGT